MKEYVCKCGSKRIFIRDNGTQTGIYCKECGKWIKWIGKKEIPFAEEYIKEQNENDNSNTNKIDEVREYVCEFVSLCCNVDYYALAGIVGDELFFYTIEERVVRI